MKIIQKSISQYWLKLIIEKYIAYFWLHNSVWRIMCLPINIKVTYCHLQCNVSIHGNIQKTSAFIVIIIM